MSVLSEAKLTVVVRITARPGKEAQSRALLKSLVEPTRQEVGCLGFDLHEMPGQPGSFMLLGNWERQAHLDAHYRTQHITAALRRLDELSPEPPTIELWRQIA